MWSAWCPGAPKAIAQRRFCVGSGFPRRLPWTPRGPLRRSGQGNGRSKAATANDRLLVPIADTVRSFAEILEGKHDELPESAFLLKGSIEDVVEAAGKSSKKDDKRDKKSDEEQSGDDDDAGEE